MMPLSSHERHRLKIAPKYPKLHVCDAAQQAMFAKTLRERNLYNRWFQQSLGCTVCFYLKSSSPALQIQALAWAAGVNGVNAHVVMTHNSTAVKVAAVRGYGASVTFCDNSMPSRESTAAAVVSEHPLSTLIPSSNDYRVQCG